MAKQSVPAPPEQTTHALRIEPASLVLALFVGYLVYSAVALLGFRYWLAPAAGFSVALLLFVGLVMAMNAVDGVRELVKQIAVWLGIVVLLPLTVWYGTNVFSPPPNWKEYAKATSRIEERIRDAQGEREKEKLRHEKDRL